MTRIEVEAGWTKGNDSFNGIAALTRMDVSVIIQIEKEIRIDRDSSARILREAALCNHVD